MLDLFRQSKGPVLAKGGGVAVPCPPDVREKIDRGERAISQFVPVWEETLAFFDNNPWVERSAVSGDLQQIETREGGKGKPRWRSRLTRNRYTPAIERARSRFAARIPVPIATAPSHNAESRSAAALAEKVCLSLYRRLGIKQLVLDLMVYTFNCGVGYIWPYWDSNVGEFIQDPGRPPDPTIPGDEGAPARVLRTGEVGYWILHPREVLSEPGVPFEQSRWYVVRKAQPVSEVKAREGYIGPENLSADAVAARVHDRVDATAADLVFVHHFLERPSKAKQKGRWLQIANGAQIEVERDYPCDYDIPVVHELADIRRPHRERPMGRGELMLDIQRTYQRTINQIVAWVNLVLNPQLLAPKGSIITRRSEEPGEVVQYKAVGGKEPKWRETPEVPVSLFRQLDQCILDWNEVSGDGDLPAGLQSGSAVAQVRNEQDESRRATFAENLARCYSGIFTHTLYLVQKHYTEPRLLELKTRFGIESIPNFLGAKIAPGTTINVDPGSVQPRTREEQEAKLIFYAQQGWIPPHQAIAAIRSGDADSLIDEYELDLALAHRRIQQLIAMGRNEGPGVAFAGPADNHEVCAWVIGAWMKTEDFERMDDLVKQATLALYGQHQAELAYQQMMQAQQTATTAATRGLSNAAGGGGQLSLPPAGGTGGGAGAPGVSMPSIESTVRGLQGTPEGPAQAA